jgi:hypothetical protein
VRELKYEGGQSQEQEKKEGDENKYFYFFTLKSEVINV